MVWLVGLAYTLPLAVSSEQPHGTFRMKDRCCLQVSSDSTLNTPPVLLLSRSPVTHVAECIGWFSDLVPLQQVLLSPPEVTSLAVPSQSPWLFAAPLLASFAPRARAQLLYLSVFSLPRALL